MENKTTQNCEKQSSISRASELFKEGFSLAMEYKFEQALEILNQAIELNPDDAGPYHEEECKSTEDTKV